MSGHLSFDTRERYLQRRLSPAELFAADDHLAACPDCREDLAASETLPDAFGAVRRSFEAPEEEPLHVPEEQLTAYLENTLDAIDREIVEGHLEGCPQCAAEVRELRAFHAMLSTQPVRTYAPETEPTLLDRLRGLFRGPFMVLPVGALGAAAAAVVLFMAVIRPANMELAAQQGRARDLERQNESLRKRTATNALLEEERARLRAESARYAREVERLREQTRMLASENQDLATRPTDPAPGPQPPSPTRPARIAINDGGGTLVRDGAGNLVRTERLPAGVDRALRRGTVAKPMVLAMLIEEGSILRGGDPVGGKLAVLGPLGTVVRSDHPTFSWTARPGATAYQVSVYDADLNEVAQSGPVRGTEWTPARSLPRGKVLQWQVTALKGEEEIDRAPQPPVPPAKLQVLAAEKAAEIERAERMYAGSHLTLGVLYAEAGLLDDAERELHALLEANPNSETARKLLRSVEALRSGK